MLPSDCCAPTCERPSQPARRTCFAAWVTGCPASYFATFADARAPNFRLNFSTRPAVSMIFCVPV